MRTASVKKSTRILASGTSWACALAGIPSAKEQTSSNARDLNMRALLLNPEPDWATPRIYLNLGGVRNAHFVTPEAFRRKSASDLSPLD
jgi:hypothetical protein